MEVSRYQTVCALPNDYERELLTILMEECAEVAIKASKLLRFGQDRVQPGQAESNSIRLAHELGDIQEVVRLLVEVGVVQADAIAVGMTHKRIQLSHFMQTAKPD